MEIKKVILVLADISGYTQFIKMRTMSLIHAELLITELLESVIGAAEFPLRLNKLEGDAVFLYASFGEDDAALAARDVTRQVLAFFEAFKAKQRELVANQVCTCDACMQVDHLKLKALLHHGEAVCKQIRQFEELAGDDVILIHRLLKNTIPAKEYILMTEPIYGLSGGLTGQAPENRIEEAKGIGQVQVRVYYLGEQPTPSPTISTSLWGKAIRFLHLFGPYFLLRLFGIRHPAGNFAHRHA